MKKIATRLILAAGLFSFSATRIIKADTIKLTATAAVLGFLARRCIEECSDIQKAEFVASVPVAIAVGIAAGLIRQRERDDAVVADSSPRYNLRSLTTWDAWSTGLGSLVSYRLALNLAQHSALRNLFK